MNHLSAPVASDPDAGRVTGAESAQAGFAVKYQRVPPATIRPIGYRPNRRNAVLNLRQRVLEPAKYGRREYRGTAMLIDGALVFHVFEIVDAHD